VRDYQIKEAFKKVEHKLEHKSRIDAMLSGTTCVTCFFNHDMILCANAGDSRAILVSEHEARQNGPGEGNYYYT
jgi:serine/threonine protein phosphatase PrpC